MADDGFVKVGSLGAIAPGHLACAQLEGHPILLANVDGEIYATDDTCTHEQASLCSGSMQDGLLKCPLHNSRFDVRTGAPLEEPAETPLKIYEVRVEGDDILVRP